MNVVAISGYIQEELKLSYSNAGKEYVNFTLINKTGFGDNANTNYFKCIVFGKVANNLVTYKKKGDFIIVIGEVNVKPYTANDGSKKLSVQIMASNVDFAPVGKVTANEIKRPYDQSVNPSEDFSNFNTFASDSGLDGTINKQQLNTSKTKPYKDTSSPFGDFTSDFDISGDDLGF